MAKRKKKTTRVFRVHAFWSMSATTDVEATTLEEAIEMAGDMDFGDGEYISDSFEINKEVTEWLNGPKPQNSKLVQTVEKNPHTSSTLVDTTGMSNTSATTVGLPI